MVLVKPGGRAMTEGPPDVRELLDALANLDPNDYLGDWCTPVNRPRSYRPSTYRVRTVRAREALL